MELYEAIARSLFERYGLNPGLLTSINDANQFSTGDWCYGLIFENGYLHFHVGKEIWKDTLAADAPTVRIRSMEHEGISVAEPDWFPC